MSLGERMGGKNPLTRTRCQTAGLAALGLLATAVAEAHDRPTSLSRILLHPSEPDPIVAVGTWGLALSRDRGLSWRWACAAAYDVDPRVEDPAAAWSAAGTLYLGTYLGLRVLSGPTHCQVERPAGRLGEGFVIDLAPTRGGGRSLAVLSELGADDVLYALGPGPEDVEELHRVFGRLVDRVRVAPSSDRHVYLSAGQIRFAGTPYRSFLLASTDGGRSFTQHEFPLEEGENLLLLDAVSPADPRRLFGHVVGFRGESALERVVRSDDGGATWRTVLEAPDARSIAISEDGARVFVGSALGGLWRSEDGGEGFELVNPNVHVRCLTWRGGSLYLCADPALDGFALGVSTNGGESVEPRLRLSEIAGMANCPSCSTVGFVCPAWSGDVIYDLELDATLPEGFDPDAGTGEPRDAGPHPPACAAPDAGATDVGGDGSTAPTPPDSESSCACAQSRESGGRPSDGPGPISGLALLLSAGLRRSRTAQPSQAKEPSAELR